ncbi:MAG: helix-turn-helix domain-containing protein [Polyangiaceae bacterium]
MTASKCTVFFEPAPELRGVVEFGFAAANYRRRPRSSIRRVPTARGTIYFAAHVRGPGVGYREMGLYCEGPHAEAFDVTHESDEIVALKVRPGGLGALLGIAARDVRDRTLDLADVWGSRAKDLADRVATADSTAERIRLLQREIAAHVAADGLSTNQAIDAAAMVTQRQGRVRVDELSRRCGVSQRTLLQRFDDGVGLAPKQYARLVRLRSAMTRLVSPSPVDCSDVAVACGYADQAHMIHEFRSLVGLSPLAYCRTSPSFGPEGAVATGRVVVPRCERTLYRSLGFVRRWACHSPGPETGPSEQSTA